MTLPHHLVTVWNRSCGANAGEVEDASSGFFHAANDAYTRGRCNLKPICHHLRYS